MIYFSDVKILNRDGIEYFEAFKSALLIDSKPKKIETEAGDFVLIRSGDRIVCLDNVCPHQHRSSLHEGIISDNCIVCPLHGWKFDLLTGESDFPPKKLRTLKTAESNGHIYIEKPTSKPAFKF